MSTKTRTKTNNGNCYNRKRPRMDMSSIKTATLLYFLMFATILLILIWTLQTFFMDNYYQRMKIRETNQTSHVLEQLYEKQSDKFDSTAIHYSISSGSTIRVETADSVTIYDNGAKQDGSLMPYGLELKAAREQLKQSSFDSAAMIVKDNNNDGLSKLIHISYLGGRDSGNMLYVIAPLYPVKSTISILRQQLVYITFIAMMIAAILAYFMSIRLSAPIERITDSAIELSQGNYNVKFNGSGFTETKELARTLNTASYEMQKTDSYQKDLIANVSHDLKTPLTMIKSYAELIDDISGDDPVKRKQHLHVIIQEADRLNKLVTDMLSVSKLQSNALELNKVKFNIAEAASEVADTYRVLSEQGYEINVNICKSAWVYGDEEKLKQVMSNYISNAVKYGGENKYVAIELKRTGRKVRFDVIDHGVGIPSDEIGHVWDRYYRTSANHDRKIEGSGLGLSIVKGILTLHNANYGVESREGSGSDFWFEMDTVRK